MYSLRLKMKKGRSMDRRVLLFIRPVPRRTHKKTKRERAVSERVVKARVAKRGVAVEAQCGKAVDARGQIGGAHAHAFHRPPHFE